MTDITASGTYGAGAYTLVNNISGALVFTGTATLDMNGNTVTGTSSGNTWDYGLTFQGANSVVLDSIGGGKITGFRVGLRATAAGCQAQGIDLSGNRYFGVWVEADDFKIIGGEVSEIGGVTDEPYAIGIQAGAVDNVEVHGVRFREFYKQSGYSGQSVGEGLAVNFSAEATNCKLIGCSADNETIAESTIGVFTGVGGGHTIEGNRFRNFNRAIACANSVPATVVDNLMTLDALFTGSIGLGVHGGGTVTGNVIVRYDTPLYQDTPAEGQTVIPPSPPPPPPPPPGTWGAILDETITTHFGTGGGKTSKVRVSAAALAVPGSAPTKLRATFKATAELLGCTAYVGHAAASGDAWDAASLTQMPVGGQGSFDIAGGQTVVTDEVSFAWDRTSDLIFSFHASDGANNNVAGKTFANAVTWTKYGDTASAADDTGMGPSYGYLTLVTKIEMDGF